MGGDRGILGHSIDDVAPLQRDWCVLTRNCVGDTSLSLSPCLIQGFGGRSNEDKNLVGHPWSVRRVGGGSACRTVRSCILFQKEVCCFIQDGPSKSEIRGDVVEDRGECYICQHPFISPFLFQSCKGAAGSHGVISPDTKANASTTYHSTNFSQFHPDVSTPPSWYCTCFIACARVSRQWRRV